jgi:glycosyltransferase involved in cell wall biosynthesis
MTWSKDRKRIGKLMRVGQNPAKSVQGVPQPAEVTVAVVVYIPFLGGYYAESLEIFKLCLESIRVNTHIPYDLMVFDNASCPEVRDYLLGLHADGGIQFLSLSDKNLGKVGAWNYIVGAAPGKYISYADADVYHYPGWLAPLIDTLETFPNAGMVTGMPLLAAEEKSSATVVWAEQNPEVEFERGHLLPWEDFYRHSGTLGRPEEEQRQFYQDNPIVRFSTQGRTYYAGAGHFQFAARKKILQQFFPLSADRPMGQVRQLDDAINAAGYLRLSTPEWHVQHIGNTLPPAGSGIDSEQFLEAHPGQRTRRKSLWDLRVFQKILRWVYSKSFDILYRK